MSERQRVAFPSSPLSDPRWDLVERVANSSYFRQGTKLRAFLLYVCENSIRGRPEELTSQSIGSKVFDRPPGYNLGEDTIVRVEARELRKRLEAFFAGEGRHESMIIEIPKGAYTANFRPRELAVPKLLEPDSQGSAEAVSPAVSKRRRWLVAGLAGSLLISTGAAVWLLAANRALQRQSRQAASVEDDSFYGELLGTLGGMANREAMLVISNPKVVLYYGADSNAPITEAPDRTIAAPRELKDRFRDALNNIDKDSRFQFLRFTREDYAGMGDAVAAIHLDRVMNTMRRPVRITQGRFLNWGHVQKQDLILLGGPGTADWTHQNEIARSNFNIQARRVENLKPLPGEQKVYPLNPEPGGKALTDYGVIKMITYPWGSSVLLVAGLTSAGTGGTGEFFATRDKMKPVHDRIRAAAPGKPFPSNWEVLIKIHVRDSLAVETSAIAIRPAPTGR